MSEPETKKAGAPAWGSGWKFYTGLIISLGSLAAWAWAFGLPDLVRSVLRPLSRIVLFIGAGLLVGQILEGSGYSAKLGRLVRPLVQWTRLPVESGLSFVAAFVSGITANSLLYTAWQEHKIDRKALVLSNLLNSSLPVFLIHLPTTFFIVTSLVGQAGAAYLGLTLGAALLRMIAVVLAGRMVLSGCPDPCVLEPGEQQTWSQVWSSTWPKFRKRLGRMILLILPIYLAVSLAARLGFFSWLNQVAAGFAAGSILPVESMGLVVFALMAEFTSGFAAAGALLESGQLAFKEVVLALMIGAMLAAPIRAFRHQLSHYLAVFPPGLGVFLIVVGQSVRVASLLIVTVLFAWLF